MNRNVFPLTNEEMFRHLKSRIGDIVPEYDLALKAEIAIQINRLKKEKNALLLGHNYMEPALFHSVADFTGDSLYLSRVSAEADCDIIVFCGVRFMAETAKILNPHRKVLLPSSRGGCSLAEGITAQDVLALKERYPGAPVVSYVNTYADVKAVSDYCCTSSNGAAVVQHILDKGHKRVIFLPDEYLTANVAQQLGIKLVYAEDEGSKNDDTEHEDENVIIGWRARCEVHERFTVEDIQNVRQQYKDVVVLAHPECSPEVVAASDFSGSTTGMIRYVEQMKAGRYLLLTECSMGDNIVAKNPNREMLRLCALRCPHMGEITLEETLLSLKEERHVIEVPTEQSSQARVALDRMIGIG